MTENEVGTIIVDCAYRVHTTLGSGLLESVYEVVLAHELHERGLDVRRQHPVQIRYKDLTFLEGFRADLLVQEIVIVELKSVEEIHPVHKKQLLTQLRLADIRLGYLLNFGASRIKDGTWRIVNGAADWGERRKSP